MEEAIANSPTKDTDGDGKPDSGPPLIKQHEDMANVKNAELRRAGSGSQVFVYSVESPEEVASKLRVLKGAGYTVENVVINAHGYDAPDAQYMVFDGKPIKTDDVVEKFADPIIGRNKTVPWHCASASETYDNMQSWRSLMNKVRK